MTPLVKLKSKMRSTQKGSAMMLAVFVIVVVMLLGITLIEILSTGSEAVSQEVLGTRALAAANSGMQGQLQKLFPLNGGAPTFTCPTLPAAVSIHNYDFTAIAGLYQCSARVTFSNYVNHNSIAYYRLKSTGTCGTGTMDADSKTIVLSSRTVQVEARSL